IVGVLHNVEHALEAQQRLDARLLGAGCLAQSRGDGEYAIEGCLIEAHLARPRAPLDAEGCIDAAARNDLCDAVADLRLQGLETRREAETQIQAAVVDAANFPVPRG